MTIKINKVNPAGEIEVPKETIQTSSVEKNNYWIWSTYILAAAFISCAVFIAYYLDNFKMATLDKDNNSKLGSKTLEVNKSHLNEYPLPKYVGPGGFFELYFIQDPESLDTKVYAKTREVNPQTVELLELKNDSSEFDDVIWTRGSTNKAKFILSSHAGDSSTFYLLGVESASDLKGFRTTPADTLKFKNDFSNLPYFSYYRVLTWVDDAKILVEQTDTMKDDQSKQTVSYWIAPATDLSKKQIINP